MAGSNLPRVDPRAWLIERGWEPTIGKLGEYWNRVGRVQEPGWEGGWNLSGAVHLQLEAENRVVLEAMGLYKPPTRSRRRR